MEIEQFEEISLYVCLAILIGLMMFIVWDLAKKSKAGRFGTFIMFIGLVLGVVSFLAKSVIKSFLNL